MHQWGGPYFRMKIRLYIVLDFHCRTVMDYLLFDSSRYASRLSIGAFLKGERHILSSDRYIRSKISAAIDEQVNDFVGGLDSST
jgi:hypothetical protein